MGFPLDRRAFLRAIAATPLLQERIHAAEADGISLGFSLYGMPKMPLAESLKYCATIGYDSVELALMPGWPAEPKSLSAGDRKKLRDDLRTRKLSLAALMENLPLDGTDAQHKAHLERLAAAVELAKDLGGERPPLIETILGGKVDQFETLKIRWLDRLGDYVRIVEKAKIPLAIKPHRMNALHRPEDALWLLEKVGSKFLRLVFDWSHFEQREYKLADTLAKLAPRCVFIHVKDTLLDKGKARFVLPGEGQTDYVEYFRLLAKSGYQGSVCVEVSGMVSNQKGYDGVAAARKCYTVLNTACEKAGIRRARI